MQESEGHKIPTPSTASVLRYRPAAGSSLPTGVFPIAGSACVLNAATPPARHPSAAYAPPDRLRFRYGTSAQLLKTRSPRTEVRGWRLQNRVFLQPVKRGIFPTFMARLKSCPDTKPKLGVQKTVSAVSNRGHPRMFKNHTQCCTCSHPQTNEPGTIDPVALSPLTSERPERSAPRTLHVRGRAVTLTVAFTAR